MKGNNLFIIQQKENLHGFGNSMRTVGNKNCYSVLFHAYVEFS